MTIFYGLIIFFLWVLSGMLCGLALLNIDNKQQAAEYTYIKYALGETLGDNVALFIVISVGGPVVWILLTMAIWAKWIK